MASRLQFAVIGHPIGHSRSPEIHTAFARQFDIELDYQRIDADPEAFENCVRNFFAQGGRGMNVTLPHKEAAFARCDSFSPRAKHAAAVNTLSFDGTQLFGDNTDGEGLVRDLSRLAKDADRTLLDQRILLIGAGGATRGCVAGLIDAGVNSITIAARDATRAAALAAAFFPGLSEVPVLALAKNGADLEHHAFDVVINATSAGLSGEVPAMHDAWLEKCWISYDIGYPHRGQHSTPFLEYCTARGVKLATDGLGMLVEQAAASFFAWHGRRPATKAVLDLLRRAP